MELSFSYIRKIANWLLDILFAESCLGCGLKGEALCPNCLLKIRRAERETERNIMACFDYRDPTIKRAIWNLKYYHRSHLGQILGKLLYESFIEEVSDMRMYASGQPILVIPVPLSPTRKNTRGYNQAKRIARGFCDCGGSKILELKDNIIIKVKDTLPQAKITNRAKRLKNIKGVFEIKKKELVKGRTIIVIDDVTTTGGTITEIMSILKKSGTRKVIGFAVAH